MKNWSTTYLLTCAAIGVAGGFMLLGANWLSTLLYGVIPFFSVALAGLWLLPAVIALRLLERPFAGLLVGLISGLVIVPFSGYGFRSVATNLWWAFFVELAFLVVLYRFWTRWQYYAGAAVVGLAYPVLAWVSFDLGSLALGAQIAFFALTLASTLGATAVGIAIADALRRAGVARLARHRAKPAAQST